MTADPSSHKPRIQGAAHRLIHSCVPENVPVLQEDILESPPGVFMGKIGCFVSKAEACDEKYKLGNCWYWWLIIVKMHGNSMLYTKRSTGFVNVTTQRTRRCIYTTFKNKNKKAKTPQIPMSTQPHPALHLKLLQGRQWNVVMRRDLPICFQLWNHQA